MNPQPLLSHPLPTFSGDPVLWSLSPRASGLEARSAMASIPWLSVLLYVSISPVLYILHSPVYSGSWFLILHVTILLSPSTPDLAEGQSPGQSSLPGATCGCQACRDTDILSLFSRV